MLVILILVFVVDSDILFLGNVVVKCVVWLILNVEIEIMFNCKYCLLVMLEFCVWLV